MKHARLSCFLTLALALVALVATSWGVQPLTVAHARSSSPSAQTCTIRAWHREVHHEAGFTLTLALIGGFTPAGARCKTVGATVTLHAAKKLKGELTLLLFRASEPKPVGAGSAPGKVMSSRTYHESTTLLKDSYGWYWAKATFIPAGEGGRRAPPRFTPVRRLQADVRPSPRGLACSLIVWCLAKKDDGANNFILNLRRIFEQWSELLPIIGWLTSFVSAPRHGHLLGLSS